MALTSLYSFVGCEVILFIHLLNVICMPGAFVPDLKILR